LLAQPAATHASGRAAGARTVIQRLRKIDWPTLDRALFERWDAGRLAAAWAAAEQAGEPDWPDVASWVRARQDEAVEALAKAGLTRIAPSPGAHFQAELMTWSDEPPRPTSNAALQGRTAGVSPGHGGWLHGERLLCLAQAMAYDYGADPDSSRT